MVTVIKRKLDGTGRSWHGEIFRVGEHGTWMFCPAGSEGRDLTGKVLPAQTTDGIQLLTPEQWWTAWWWAEPSWVSFDVIEPLRSSESEGISYLDLELDLWWRDGQCGVVDQDELQLSLAHGRIDHEMAKQADLIAHQILDRLQANDPLFTFLGFRMLEQALDTNASKT